MRGFYIIVSWAASVQFVASFRLPIFGLAEIGNRLRSHGSLRSSKGKSNSKQKSGSLHGRGKLREEPIALSKDELADLGLPPGMNLSFNASNMTASGPAPPPPPPEVPRRPGPMADDPYTNATGCDPFPCELEDHYRPPLKVSPPLPLPRCGRYGEREIHLAWNGNLNHTQNLTVELSTLVHVQLGFDKTYGKPHVKPFQPSYFMDYTNGMDEYHDCREADAGYVGYFKVVCTATVSHDPYSEDEFDAEWGIGNLTIENATYNKTLNEYQPAQCIKDTFMPNLESMEFGVPPHDTQYALYVLESQYPFLDKQRLLPTTLPTYWLPQRCQTCTVPNPAYWDQIFGKRPEYNISNVTNVTDVVHRMNITNLTVRDQTLQALHAQFPKLPIEKKTFPDVNEKYPYNLTLVPTKPYWSDRILMEPLPKGLPAWSQIINPWDGIILRFDECVIADHKMITWTPLNPPPFEQGPLKPRGYRNELLKMSTRASDVYLVSVNCGNVTIRPPDILIMQNLGKLYEVEIPEGSFYDYAEVPNYSAGWKFNVTVRDLITPHVLMDWNRAFRPLAYHTGRYPWHNITIRFDEPMMPNVRYKEHKMILDPRSPDYKVIELDFHDEEKVQWQDGGIILHINPFGHMKNDFTGDPVGLELGAEYHVTIEPTVITDLFGNNFTGLSTCPKDCSVIAPLYPYEPCTCTGVYKFRIATVAQMEWRKKIAFHLKWQRRRINNTLEMFHLPTTQDEMAVTGMPLTSVWKNSATQGRMINLMFFIGQAQGVLNDPDGIIKEQRLHKVFEELSAYKFEPRGYAFKDDWVCKDMETHVLPGRMSCMYAAQKTNTGYNVALRAASNFFREGCMCKVYWQGGCPFSMSQFPNHKDLGFDLYDEKFVNGKMGSNGLTENYLCWYWSTPDFPEYGYMAHPTNYYPREVPSNEWKCAYPRIPEQPCSTLRPWEWEMPPTQKLFWNKASAWRPVEVVPEAASLIQRGNASFYAYKTIGLLHANETTDEKLQNHAYSF